MRKLTIVRGLPGSGKSTLAKSIGVLHVEADMFHMQDGEYKWKGGRVKYGHQWCYDTVRHNLMYVDVVVSNTFTQLWEMQKYLDLYDEVDYPTFELEVIKCTGDYGTIYPVPQEAIDKMANRWEDYEGEVIV